MTELHQNGAGPALSVIVPVHDSAATLGPCLAALRGAIGPNDEVIVVDDASTDGGVPTHDGTVHDGTVQFVRLDTNVGRGPARNIGADRAAGDVLVFVDSDVVIHRDALDAIRAAFHATSDRTSVIGAYDDRPGAPGIVSQYRNLLHHRTHQANGPTSEHFWTGVGAVRRDVFRKVGGLDETDWAHDMEDVEFGHRLVENGYVIEVLPHVQGTHLKHFSVRSMMATDLLHRALPWSSLMLQTGFRRNSFVLSGRQVLSVAAVFATLGAAAARATRVAGRAPDIVLVGSAGLFVLVNAPLWRFFATKRGWAFAAGCVPLHALHSLSSGLGFVLAAMGHVGRVRHARPGGIAGQPVRSRRVGSAQ